MPVLEELGFGGTLFKGIGLFEAKRGSFWVSKFWPENLGHFLVKKRRGFLPRKIGKITHFLKIFSGERHTFLTPKNDPSKTKRRVLCLFLSGPP